MRRIAVGLVVLVGRLTLAVGSLALTGCGTNGPGSDSDEARLRVRNSGSQPIVQLTVLFPNDRISFGTVAPGATTAYQRVPNGVYRYAAYRLELNGTLVTQPVIDWVGEEPIGEGDFTYTLELVPGASQFFVVRLTSVTLDD
jgi:hypothetical protein